LKTFEELELIAPVQRAVADEKYETPTPIQAKTVPAALVGRDVLGCAQTGTGKTAAFALPILNRLGQRNRKATPNRPFVLVLAPTRELAIQIEESFATYGRHLRLRQALVYGGVSQGKQVRALNRGAHILVATPGRLLDLMSQGHIELDQLKAFVLDEADRMLDMGFLPDLKRIIRQLPDQRQSLFFSATLPPKIIELSQRLLRNPVSVNVTPESTSVEKIEQRVLFVERSGKQALLQGILRAAGVERALVFTKTKRAANMLAERLVRSGIKATAIHGNKSQSARQRALEAFRRKQVQVLVATDVAARGIDIDGITHVVNFDLPIEPEGYVHRIGRTGRAGAKGVALSFCCASERRDLRAIEKLIGQKVPIALEQPQPELREHRPSGRSRGRRDAALQRSDSKGSGPRRPATRRSADASGEAGKPKQKRRRRKRSHPRQHVKQTS
jgi:ATP-dependent RNA helicase RhlE